MQLYGLERGQPSARFRAPTHARALLLLGDQQVIVLLVVSIVDVKARRQGIGRKNVDRALVEGLTLVAVLRVPLLPT